MYSPWAHASARRSPSSYRQLLGARDQRVLQDSWNHQKDLGGMNRALNYWVAEMLRLSGLWMLGEAVYEVQPQGSQAEMDLTGAQTVDHAQTDYQS